MPAALTEPVPNVPTERPTRPHRRVKPPKKHDPEAPCRPHYGRKVVDLVFSLGALGLSDREIAKRLAIGFPGLAIGKTTIALWLKYGVTRVRERGREEDL